MAAIETLTDKAIQAAIRTARKSAAPVVLSDGGGLSLEVQSTGVGWWRMRYWLATREKRMSLGTYPDVTLAMARKRRREARKMIEEGVDPVGQRRAARAEAVAKVEAGKVIAATGAAPGSFKAVAAEWLKAVHEAKVSAGHAERTRIRFEQDVYPYVGHRPIAEVEAPELLSMLRRIEARGAIETAHRAKDACGQVFRYGIAAGYCSRNPAADLREALRPVPTRHHAAIVDPKRGGELLRALSDYQGRPVTRAALALSAMLLLRPGELRQLEWAWVDLEGATLTVPGQLMKRNKADKLNGQPHVVPLAPQAVNVLRALRMLTGGKRYLFPSLHTGERPMSDGTVNVALRRMGFDKETMTAHGFRAMARTMIAERLAGIAPEVIEAQLAHAVGGSLGRAYDRTQYLEQRRDMMVKWADYLDRLREGAQVLPLAA